MLTRFTTSDGYHVLFLYLERLSMDVSSSCLPFPHSLSPLPPSLSQEVFDREHASNETRTWLLRGLGWLLTVVGFNLVAGILTTLGGQWAPQWWADSSTCEN